MNETKTEFLKRKKAEKRSQAVRQVMDAYALIKEYQSKDEYGEFDEHPVRGLIIDNEFVRWRIRMEPEIEDLYSTIDISKALEIPRERLRDWIVKGFIKPSLPSTSKGTIAIFTRADVIGVSLMQMLINRGLKRETAAEYVNKWVENLPNLINAIRFIFIISTTKKGEKVFNSATIIGEKPIFMEMDSDGNVTQSPFGPMVTNAWEDIHIINMTKLCKDVDSALAKLFNNG